MIVINQGKEKNLLKHNPWVFSGAIESVPENFCGVDKVVTHDGKFIAWGYYDALSHIQVHLISWDEKQVIDEHWWMEKVKESVLRRKAFFKADSDTNVFRIIHGEADGLAGVELQILETLGQAQDHPIRVSLPETEYLKVFILRVIKGNL